MSGEFLFRCIGLIDDSLVEKSIKQIGKIKSERRIRFFSSVAAAIVLIIAIPIGFTNYNEWRLSSLTDDLFYEQPTFEIGDAIYQELSTKDYDIYGLPDNPNSNLINDFVGTYKNFDGIPINVYSLNILSEKNILLGEYDGKFVYLVFGNKTNSELFAEVRSFLEFFGYYSESDIISLSVNGKTINDIEIIDQFRHAIFNSKIRTFDDYAYAVYKDEWTDDKVQENYNSCVDIELNVGTPNYLRIRYSALAKYFISHGCYLRIDDSLAEKLIKQIGKIRNERRISFFSSVAAVVFLIVAILVFFMSYNKWRHSRLTDDSLYKQPAYEIEDTLYQELSTKNYDKYGLPDNPNSNLIDDFIGTYKNIDGISINVYSLNILSEKNILLGENDGKFVYLVFRDKTNSELFADVRSFLEFFGYYSELDIISLSVNGKTIKDIEIVNQFRHTIFNSKIRTFDDYAYAVYKGEWTDDKAQENYNSCMDIELNVGTPNYLKIRYSALAKHFISHGCYLRIE